MYIASGSTDETIRLWNVTDGSLVRLMQSDESVRCIEFSPDGNYLASGGEDNHITIWDIGSGNKVTELKSHKSRIDRLHWNSNSHLYSSSIDGTIMIWTNPTTDTSKIQFQTDSIGTLNIQSILHQTVCLVRKPYYNVKSFVNIPKSMLSNLTTERRGRRYMWSDPIGARTCCLRVTRDKKVLKRVKIASEKNDSSARTTPRKTTPQKDKSKSK